MSKPQIIRELEDKPEALEQEIDTMGSIPLKKIIEIALKRTEDNT